MQNIRANVLSSDVHSQLRFCVPMKRLSAWVQRGYVMPHCGGESQAFTEPCSRMLMNILAHNKRHNKETSLKKGVKQRTYSSGGFRAFRSW